MASEMASLRQRQIQHMSAVNLSGGCGTKALLELSVLLANNTELADERVALILGQAPAADALQDHTPHLNDRQLYGVLAIARFLSHSTGLGIRKDLWKAVLAFLYCIPRICFDEYWQCAASSYTSSLFAELVIAVGKIGEANSTLNEEISHSIAEIVPKLVILSNQTLDEPISPGIKSFLVAMGENCLALLAADVESVTKCLLDQWFWAFYSGTSQSSIASAEASNKSNSEDMSETSNSTVHQGQSDSAKKLKETPNKSSSDEIQAGEMNLDAEASQTCGTLGLTSSTTGVNRMPSKLTESSEDSNCEPDYETEGSLLSKRSLDHSEGKTARESSDNISRSSLDDDSLQILERQELAFRLSTRIFDTSGIGRHLSDAHVQHLRNSASTMLKSVFSILKMRRSASVADGELFKSKLELKLRACREASVLQTRCLLLSVSRAKSRGFLRDSFPVSLDAADACVASPWRKLQSCKDLFNSLVGGVGQVGALLGSYIQRCILLRLKAIILAICAQGEVWSPPGRTCTYESVASASCSILEAAWNSDKPVVESFFNSLASHVGERNEKDERGHEVVCVQSNLIFFLSCLVQKFNKLEIVEIILPQFVETFEQDNASLPSLPRLKLMEELARVGTLGDEKSYREVVVLLTRDYLDKIDRVNMEGSRGLAAEIVTEYLHTLANALLRLARGIGDLALRSDLRERLLTLCSNVGLKAEAKYSRGGAMFLGPLLPAVAEMCSDVDPTHNAEPHMLKLFRNLWFYLALFRLVSQAQGTPLASSKRCSSLTGKRYSQSSEKSNQNPVGEVCLWNPEWSAAVQKIAMGTPPLVISVVKWLEDDIELKGLLTPDKQKDYSLEKAALSDRVVLSASVGGLIEASALSTMSGVKAIYLLSVALLETMRLRHSGGLLRGKSGQCMSALTSAFKYLETPELLNVVQQFLAAIVQHAFSANFSWLGEKKLRTEAEALEHEMTLALHTSFLIRAMCHRMENVRDMADSLLDQLKSRFPQVLWTSRCLDELLSLIVDVSQPSSPTHAGAPASLQAFWNQRVREWISRALVLAPSTVQGLLQEKFQKLNARHSTFQSSDLLSLLSDLRLDLGKASNMNIPAVLAAAAAAGGTRLSAAIGSSGELLSSGVFSANVKSNCTAEIAGMRKLYDSKDELKLPSTAHSKSASGTLESTEKVIFEDKSSGSASVGEDSRLRDILASRFVQMLQQILVSAEKGSLTDPGSLRQICLRSAAFILSETMPWSLTREMFARQRNEVKTFPDAINQLLRLLCWCPAHIFTPEALETGVFVWTWLLSAAPHLGSRVLAELVDAWLWTIDAKKGIFACESSRSGPAAKLRPHLEPGEPEKGLVEDPVNGIWAHQIWLGFLFDRLEVVKNSSPDQLFLMSRLLQGSLKSTSHFSSHPAASGTFFSLMLLGLKFCASQAGDKLSLASLSADILEQKIYRAALGWFSVKAGGYDPNVPGVLEAEAKCMTMFVQHLMESRPRGTLPQKNSRKASQRDSSTHSSSFQAGVPHPVWGEVGDCFEENERRRLLLLTLCQSESERLETWARPLNKEMAPQLKISADQWSDFATTAWAIDHRLALSLVTRYPNVLTLRSEITSLVRTHLATLYDIPEALPFFVTPRAVEEDSYDLLVLPYWAPCSITQALEFLTPPYKGHHRVMAYVLRVMETYPPKSVTFFMPQLVQSLQYDQKGLVQGYLLAAAQRSQLFAHILIWQLQGEEGPKSTEIGKENRKATKNNLYDIVPDVRQQVIDGFTPEDLDFFEHEFDFFDKVTSICGTLYPLPKDERRSGIRRELENIHVECMDLYLPTAPDRLVRGIQVDSGIPLQSAAKVPIMITFDVIDRDGDPSDVKSQACIFKVGDDCRQDVLALQVISLLRDIVDAVGIRLFLFPYGVLPTGYGRGIIEVVPNTRSRNQMAVISDGGLIDNFQQDFGPIGSKKFEEARENFIKSSAGYAVASFLLQPKDRHNGNLLFDKDGHMVHIDFGFILETSPGGNLRFESAHFKLSHEMTQLLDPSGEMKSEPWHRFVSLSVKGYLAARQHMNGIINMVLLMKDSGLPCFGRGDPIGNLRKRFHPEMTEREAANFMMKTCEDAYNKWTTSGYDLIQYLQQGIEK